ncbi:MAG: hypothetical protein ACRCYA_05410 [Cetobacterium sp.]|uniref:hypothetical protein n=1 Tax=Cetobacterium sp. TaxID=2071632 RepID=UPI003EE52E92
MTVLEGLENFWYDFFKEFTNYEAILRSVELSESDYNDLGYPLIRYSILDVNKKAEGMLYTRTKKTDKIEERFNFNASYILDFDIYFKAETVIDIERFTNMINNQVLMSRYCKKIDYSKYPFKHMVIRGNLEENPNIDMTNSQTTSRNNYQVRFVVDIITTNDVGYVKSGTIKEEVFNEVN